MVNISCIKTDKKYYDLSHLLVNEMDVFPGDTPVSLKPTNIVAQDGFANSKLITGMHIGTHMDGPAHMIKNGKCLFEFDISKFFGYCDVLDATCHNGVLGIELLEQLPKSKGRILLIRTDYSQFFGEDSYYYNYPVLTEELANSIVILGYEILGLDTPSPDKAPYNIHKILLSNEVLIIENLTNLNELPKNKEIFLTALPIKLEADSAPVRVVAEVL